MFSKFQKLYFHYKTWQGKKRTLDKKQHQQKKLNAVKPNLF